MKSLKIFISALLTLAILIGLTGCGGIGRASIVPDFGNGSLTDEKNEENQLVTLSSYYSDGMVIQRDKPINISGFCSEDGAEITVRLGDEERAACVSNGKWSVSFEQRAAQRGIDLTVFAEASDERFCITYRDVAIGDLWIMSGQSNIAYTLGVMENSTEYITNARNFDNIRFFAQPTAWSLYEDRIGSGKWFDATGENLMRGDVSAIGYVLATRLAAEFPEVTVGVVDCAFAGSMVQPFINGEVYKRRIIDSDNSYYSYESLKAFRSFYEQRGRNPITTAELKPFFSNENAYYSLTDSEVEKPQRLLASVCYNSLISPLEGIGAKGVVWYHGEGNCIGEKYIPYYNAVTESFRSAFCDETLPFYVIQLAPYFGTNYASSVSDTKAAQFNMSIADGNSYVVGTSLEGFAATAADYASGQNDSASLIHPARKAPIGLRLASEILKHTYGKSDVLTAPKPVKTERRNGEILITFDSELDLLWGDKATGFEVSADGAYFVKAEATVYGNTVTVSSPLSNPTYVRYGYGNLTFELKDGTVIEAFEIEDPKSDKTVKVTTSDSKTYLIALGDVIRGYIDGNLTNGSGHPAPTFKLPVGYERWGG